MKSIRGLVAVLLIAAASFTSSAWATSFTTDQSDVYSVEGENGWGFQIVQRGSVIFLTMYVYDPMTAPIFYTATLVYQGNFVWTGDLYLTHGSWFGARPYNPIALGFRKVGTMTWTAMTVTSGQLKYNVDGVFIVKNPTRLLLVYDDFSGHYGGGFHQITNGCQNPAFNGTAVKTKGTLDITQSGQSIALVAVPSSGASCTYNGALTQAGQMGTLTGTYACSDGDSGVFQLFEMQVNPIAVTGRLSASSNTFAGCQSTGWFFGGLI